MVGLLVLFALQAVTPPAAAPAQLPAGLACAMDRVRATQRPVAAPALDRTVQTIMDACQRAFDAEADADAATRPPPATDEQRRLEMVRRGLAYALAHELVRSSLQFRPRDEPPASTAAPTATH